MTLAFTDINLVPADLVEQNADFLAELSTELIPGADFRRGTVLFELLIKPSAFWHSLAEINVKDMQGQASLLWLIQNPDLATDEMVDNVLSNFLIVREAGTKSAGSLNIVLTTNVVTAIPAGAEFTWLNLKFRTTQAFIGVPDENMLLSAQDRLIRPYGSGWAFTVDVEAEDVGPQYMATAGTFMTMSSPPANFVSASAVDDFSTARSTETNDEMIGRLRLGISGRTISSRLNTEKLLRTNWPDLLEVSIIGMGDPEMTRDKHSIFGIATGGKSTIYVQTAQYPEQVKLEHQAQLVDPSAGRWQMSLGRDDAAGVYKPVSIKTVGSADYGTLTITAVMWSVDLPEDSPKAIATFEEAAFTSYQTLTVEFLDPTSAAGLAFGATSNFEIDLVKMPDISAIQEFVDDRTRTNYRYDDLIRGPIPCFVSASMTISAPRGSDIQTAAVQAAIADRVNNLGFTDELSSSVIVDAAHNVLPEEAFIVMPIHMIGEYIDPSDGSSVLVKSETSINLSGIRQCMTDRTIMFFSASAEISVNIQWTD